MNIPVDQLLRKINEHLQLATNQPEAKLREHMMAIRTLCDLILEDHHGQQLKAPQIQVIQPIGTSSGFDDDGANGDSLFDF